MSTHLTLFDFVESYRRRGFSAASKLCRLSGLSAAAFATMLSTEAYGDELKGTILDAGRDPKPFVSVDILGPTKVFTQSDKDGRFIVNLSSGRYIVRIRDDRHRAEFSVMVIGNLEEEFQLEW